MPDTESIGQLTNLETLDLTECTEQVPGSIDELTHLQSLDLCGCWNLDSLPDKLVTGQLTSLMTLDISGCHGLSVDHSQFVEGAVVFWEGEV